MKLFLLCGEFQGWESGNLEGLICIVISYFGSNNVIHFVGYIT